MVTPSGTSILAEWTMSSKWMRSSLIPRMDIPPGTPIQPRPGHGKVGRSSVCPPSRGAPAGVLFLIGHNGRLQMALYIVGEYITIPVVVSPKAFPLINAYRQHGYTMPDVSRSDLPEATGLLFNKKPALALVTLNERRHLPWVRLVLQGFKSPDSCRNRRIR